MARGYPDYFGQSIWPKFGSPMNHYDSYNCNGGSSGGIMSITGQGVLYFFRVQFTACDDFYNIIVEILIDGHVFFFYSVQDMLDMGMLLGAHNPLVLTEYDLVGKKCAIIIGKEIPYRSSVQINADLTSTVDDAVAAVQGSYYIIS